MIPVINAPGSIRVVDFSKSDFRHETLACEIARGATPTQVKVGIQLALGKTKPVIADELGIKPSSVADQAKRLYQTLDIHNSTELSTKIWLGERPSETRQSRPPGWVIEPNAALRRKQEAYSGMR